MSCTGLTSSYRTVRFTDVVQSYPESEDDFDDNTPELCLRSFVLEHSKRFSDDGIIPNTDPTSKIQGMKIAVNYCDVLAA
jgi:hypothetical protein